MACSLTGPWRRTSRPQADPRLVSAPLRSTLTTMERLISSWPTVTRMTSPGSTPRWPRPRNFSWAGITAVSSWPAPASHPISLVRWSAGGSPPATLTTMVESTWWWFIATLRRPCSTTIRRGGHWLGLRLRGTRSGRSPVGARVICQAGGRSRVRWLTSGTSYLSSSDPRLWFGLGSALKAERLEVRWPSGTVQTWSDVAADRILELREGDDQPKVRTTITPARETIAPNRKGSGS